MKLINRIKKVLGMEKVYVECINNIGFSNSIMIGEKYELLETKDNIDGSKSYKIIDDNGNEKFVNEIRFKIIEK